MQTGENEQALRRIIDFTRFISLAILILHFYISCYAAFKHWGLTKPVVNSILLSVSKLTVFKSVLYAKLSALFALMISLLGSKGKKDEKINLKTITTYALIGLLLYFISAVFLNVNYSVSIRASLYIGITSLGYLLILSGLSALFRMLKLKLADDIFNKANESFPQEERYLDNEYSINLPACIIRRS
ncbi:YWFCY domain-containing protein [Mucilaginibacter daejeonensis]|uniref:YWFCY domain-containing protein n=1 Tax=Mucilaginibacter daejeonensis TaxID=398049 RepID=UPI001D171444|nr:YWFCY domain-containing protein [Mucilaginibacter daejeonensis]UEG51402.1 YWFCY domain-containing protein [Mucilaginibacter daejeonensis]